MACLDHVCTVCGYAWMDNQIAREPCPKCGGRVSNDFDEVPDWDDHQHDLEEETEQGENDGPED